MTTIDNIMALADDYADEKQISVRFSSGGFSTTMSAQMEVINKRESLRTALTEADKEAFARGMAVRPASAALANDGSLICEGTKAQPVREPLQDSLAWELWLNAVDTANNTGRLVAYTYKEAIERAHNIRGEN